MWPDGLAGVSKSGLFRVSAPWVDAKLPPGHSSQTQALGLRATLSNIVTLKYLVMSPNLVWLAIAAAIYGVFPYDISGAGAAGSAAAAKWISARACVNFSLCFAYTAFFRVQLYWRGRAQRKYRAPFHHCIFVTPCTCTVPTPRLSCATACTTCSTGARECCSELACSDNAAHAALSFILGGRGGSGWLAASGLLAQ